MNDLDTLKNILVEEANKILDPLLKAECLVDIVQWYQTRKALNAFEEPSITSYSIGGRSVTRAQIQDVQFQESALLNKIKSYIGYSGGSLVVC